MPRPKWTPKTDEQRDAVAALSRAAKRLKTAEDTVWDAVAAARAVNVPMSYIAGLIGKGRATLYRPRPGASQQSGDGEEAT